MAAQAGEAADIQAQGPDAVPRAGRQISIEEEMVLKGVGREEGIYNRDLQRHDHPGWVRDAFDRVAEYVITNVRARTGNQAYMITGPECKEVYRKLRKQYHVIQKKIFRGLWVKNRLIPRNDQIIHHGYYFERHVHHKNPAQQNQH